MTDDPNPLSPLERGESRSLGADQGFADRLEASLRVAHADRRRPHDPIWRRIAVVVPAMVVLLVVASVVVLVRDESPSAALMLTDAHNVTVHLPDGTSVVDPVDGFELLDGAVIEIRDGGSATIDEVIVDTAAVLTVRDGLLVSDVAGTTTTERPTIATDPVPMTDPTTTSAPDSDRTTSTTTAAPPPTSRVLDTTTTTVRTTRAIEDPPVDALPPADDQVRHHVALEISLRVRVGDRGVGVAWNVAGADDGWATILVRRAGPPISQLGPGSDLHALLADPDVTLVGETSGSGPGELIDDVDLGSGAVSYRVLVLDAVRGIVGASPAQTIGR